MRLQRKFTILVVTIIIIPILVALVVAYFQFIYLQKNQMIFNRTYVMKWVDRRITPFKETPFIRESEEVLPKGMDIMIFDSGMNVLASSFDAFEVGKHLTAEEISRVMQSHMDRYQYFLEALPVEDAELRMLIRVEKQDESQPIRLFSLGTFVYLFLLLLGLAAIVSSVMLSTTNKSIQNLEEATKKIAAGNLDFSLQTEGDDELASLTSSFDSMRKALKEELARRSRFLMAVSHDLKTPLTSIEGYIEAIIDGYADDPELLKRYLHIVQDKSKVLESRILELIDFVKMETGEWQLKQTEINLKSFLLEAAKTYKDDASVLGRDFYYSIDIADDVTVSADGNLVSRALENLFNNAVRYTEYGDTIWMRAFQGKDEVTVQIEDSGPGIPKEEVDLIFDAFYRGSRSRREQGFGLGLSIVRSIIHAHTWDIDVQSQPDVGTVFSIHIPLDGNESTEI
ncbi:MAG: ATP-binding protein [Spirochaetia bacterium]